MFLLRIYKKVCYGFHAEGIYEWWCLFQTPAATPYQILL